MTTEQKYQTVLDKNTFYFYNPVFQEKYESYINSLNETLLVLKNKVKTEGLKKSIFENLLAEKENGLRALLALTGFAELKKLSISKLNFEIPAMIDTLVRYKEKGSYSGQAENNPEFLIKTILEDLKIPFEKGDLEELFKHKFDEKRTMDFILPSKANPQIIIESSFLVTTSSGQGDKSKTEGNIKKLIEQYYPKAKFIGFVDGIGWHVRQGDLKRMVTAFDEVFTFHKDELDRFKDFLKQNLK